MRAGTGDGEWVRAVGVGRTGGVHWEARTIKKNKVLMVKGHRRYKKMLTVKGKREDSKKVLMLYMTPMTV